MLERATWTTGLAATLAVLAAGCGSPELPGPTRGTWQLTEMETGRNVTVTDTTVRVEVDPEAVGGSATLQFDGTAFERSGDHLRVTFDGVTKEQFVADTFVSRRVMSRDSTVLEQGGERLVTASPDSVLPGRGRLVLVPHADSSLTLGAPSDLIQGGGTEVLEQMASVAWPDSGKALEEMDGWVAIRYRSYRN